MAANISFFFLPFLTSLLVGLTLLTVIVFFFSPKADNVRTNKRHIHHKNISRFGGIGIIIAFLAALSLDKHLVITTQFKLVILASLAILIFGIVDDFKQLSWKKQLLFQIVLVVLLGLCGIRLEYVTNPFGGLYFFNSAFGFLLGLTISSVWVIFLINTMNWVDGIDGVSGVVTLIAALTIFFLSLKPEVNQPPIGIVTAALAGAVTAFLIYNFHPAKIIAGTSGSMFMGFILAVLAIFSGAKIATTLMVLAIPSVDALWVLGERMYHKKSIFKADQRHLHHKLLKIGWSVKKIFFFYFCTTSIIAILSLKMRSLGKLATMLIFSLLLLAIMSLLAKNSLYKNEENK